MIRVFFILTALYLSSGLSGNNPEFQRVNNFNHDWRFQPGEIPGFTAVDFNDTDWRILDVPHDWSVEGAFSESSPAGSPGGYLPNGMGCYRKSFTLPETLRGKRISIRFDGVYMNSTVYLNGIYLGNRPYGFSSFEYDLTPYLNYGEAINVIAVKVDHSLQPSCRWYTGSGINRNVSLLVKSQQHFRTNGIFFRTEELAKDHAGLKIDFEVVSNNYPESQKVAFQPLPDSIRRVIRNARIVSQLLDDKGMVKATGEKTFSLSDYTTVRGDLQMTVQDPELWSDASPYLYTLKNQLIIEGRLADEETFPVGIRQIQFNSVEGMVVNGRKTIIKGVCLHKDAGSFGTAVPKDIWRYRLGKLKAMGCNAIRTHGPVDPVFIEACDEMGFLMMAEAFDEWNTTWEWGFSENPAGKLPYTYHLFFDQWGETDLKDMIRRDRNHPSVCMYSVGNEVPDQRIPEGTAKLVRLKHWVKECDNTRPVVSACDWSPFADQTGFMDSLDIAGYNYIDRYFPNLYADEHRKYPNRIYLGTETYANLKNWLAVRDNPFVTGEFLWVGIDYLGEAIAWPRRGWDNGLIDLAGFEKPTYYIRQSYWSDKPMVHIAVNLKKTDDFPWHCFHVASHWNFEKQDVDTVYVYSNCSEVELFLNNKSLGRKKVDRNTYYALYRVKYQKGSLRAVALDHSKILAEHSLTTAGLPHHLALNPDRKTIASDSGELLYVPVEICDKNGVRCPQAEGNVTVEVEGAGELIGLDSGNQYSHERYKTNSRNAYEGRLLAIVRPTGPGMIQIKVVSDGLLPSDVSIAVK